MMSTSRHDELEANRNDLDTIDGKALTRRILWKLDVRVLPALALLWLANFLDRCVKRGSHNAE